MYITSVHRIPSRMAKTEGYNENYCPGGWVVIVVVVLVVAIAVVDLLS